MKQLYPPPDGASSESEQPAQKPAKAASRGALMRPADAPPVPKGKVRQLYPPPPEIDASLSSHASTTHGDALDSFPSRLEDEDTAFPPGAGSVDASSLFVSDAAELEERKARARERAEERRRMLGQDEANPGEGGSSSPSESGPEGSQESGDWPAF